MKKWILVSTILVSFLSAHAEVNGNDLATDEAINMAIAAEEQAASESKAKVNASEDKALANKAESEIPLKLDKEKKAATEGGTLFKLLLSFSVLGVIGTGAFLFFRKYSVPSQLKSQTQIKVLQQHYLGPKKSLAIVRVAGESILIGVTDNSISHIKTLSLLDEEIPEETPQQFGGVLKGLGNDKDFSDENDEINSREDFAFGGLKEAVSKRLRNMRSLE